MGLAWQQGPLAPRAVGRFLAEFADPDGNTWTLQEIGLTSPALDAPGAREN